MLRFARSLVLLLLCLPLLQNPAQGQSFDVVLRRGGLANTFARLNSSQPVRIAYLGGSVTEQTGWRTNVTAWFQGQYPGLVTETNAGWPGTGSAIGVLRLPYDVLPVNANLVFIEFAINDETGDVLNFIMRNYDGMVRQIWQQNPMADICFIETLADYILPSYLSGVLPTTVEAHYQIANHYGIPSVNVGWALYQQVQAGTPLSQLLPDGAHPSAQGHQIYSDAVISLLNSERTAGNPSAAHPLPSPKTDFPIMGTNRVMLGDLSLPAGWTRQVGWGVPSYAESSTQNAEITVNFTGPIAILKFIMNWDGGEVGYSIDGGPFSSFPLNTASVVHAFPIAKNLSTTGNHTARIRVLSSSGVVRVVLVDSAIPNTTIPTATPSPTPSGTNLALNRPCYASTEFDANTAAAKAVDGSITAGSKWTNSGDLPNWWVVDLGASATLNTVIVYAAQAGGEQVEMNLRSYTVRGTNNNSTTPDQWTTLATYNSGQSNGASQVSHSISGFYRYIGLYITNAGIDAFSRVPEVRVYGVLGAVSPTPTPTIAPITSTPTRTPTQTFGPTPTPFGTNLALNKSCFASTEFNAATAAAKAVDGVITGGAKWTNAGDLPNWWYVDLGAAATLSHVIVHAAQAGGEEDYMNLRAYTVRGANNNSTTPDQWAILATYDSGGANGASQRTSVVTGSYRYVGLYITNSGADTYSRVPEVQVFGIFSTATATPTPTPTLTPVPTSTRTPSPSPTAIIEGAPWMTY